MNRRKSLVSTQNCHKIVRILSTLITVVLLFILHDQNFHAFEALVQSHNWILRLLPLWVQLVLKLVLQVHFCVSIPPNNKGSVLLPFEPTETSGVCSTLLKPPKPCCTRAHQVYHSQFQRVLEESFHMGNFLTTFDSLEQKASFQALSVWRLRWTFPVNKCLGEEPKKSGTCLGFSIWEFLPLLNGQSNIFFRQTPFITSYFVNIFLWHKLLLSPATQVHKLVLIILSISKLSILKRPLGL